MVDVDTIIGESIVTSSNVTIIPISKVSFGFAAGGSEFNSETVNEYSKKEQEEAIQYKLPFGGGSAAGVNINPVAFLVIQDDTIKLMSVEHESSIDKLLEYVPDLIEKVCDCMYPYEEEYFDECFDDDDIFEEVSREEVLRNTDESKTSEEKVKENLKEVSYEPEIPVESDGELLGDE